MNIFRSRLFALLFILAGSAPLCADQQTANFTVKQGLDLKVVPFVEAKHGKQAKSIYSRAFSVPPEYVTTPLLCGKGNPSAHVLMFNGVVIGFIKYQDEINQNGQVMRYVNLLAIDPDYHNHKLGTHFMQQFEALSRSQGITSISLNAVSRATPFYTRLGFEATSSYSNYMVKNLEPFQALDAIPANNLQCIPQLA